MTDLTLEEFSKLAESLDTIERFTPDYEETGDALIHLQTSEVRRLLAMARELGRFKSCLAYLDAHPDSDQLMKIELFYAAAVEMGWPDPLPPSERKGEG